MNEGELRQLYERYAYLIFRRCRTLLSNRADAEDAMHEVFVRAQRHQPRANEAPLAWLYTAATSVCFDVMRRRRTVNAAADRLESLDVRVTGHALDADRNALIGRALRELDEDVCQIGLLHHLGGLTQEEVGEQLGLSRKTVGKKLQRFDEALREWTAEVVA